MVHKVVIYTSKAPAPVGPYSQGVVVEGWLYIAGQITIDPSTGSVVKGSLEKQVRRVLENIKAIVEAAGGSLENIVKTTVYSKDLTKFSEFNNVYAEYFKNKPPARAILEASNLPKDVDVEIDAIAYVGSGSK